MRSSPERYCLSFLLPPGVAAGAGWPATPVHGCELDISLGNYVRITGPSREALFDVAAAVLRTACRDLGPLAITAQVHWRVLPRGTDSWTILIGADVAFSPTSIDPYFPRDIRERPPPVPLLAAAGR